MGAPLAGECGGEPAPVRWLRLRRLLGLTAGCRDHGGVVRAYVRICPAGHLRAGNACANCAGEYQAVICLECPGRGPAILVEAQVFRAMPIGSAMARLRVMEAGRG